MTIKYICDGCKKEVGDYEHLINIILQNTDGEPADPTDYKTFAAFDFCNDCLKEIDKLISNWMKK